MTFVRAAFAFVLLTPVVGLVGSRYLVTAMLAQNPRTAMAPVVSSSHPRPTRPPSPTPTSAPTPSPTVSSSPTARPRASSTPTALTPTIVLIMRATAVSTATEKATRSKRRTTTHAPRPTATARPRPSATRAPRPTASPTPGIVVLARYWIGNTSAPAGSTIGFGYVIQNSTGRTARVMLGASIKSTHVLSWLDSISDPSHDVIATVPPGITTHIRYFTLARTLHAGTYDVAWGLRDTATGRSLAVVWAPASLHVAH